ncbi:MAG: RNA polymerase sigma factor RpoH [Gammaproteobacteria bacterium]|nr:RNA polymerase sigma factor RpoH [Gammaproteobacteria bacterium]NND61028.1 RNA polymerase sigma factor RpoH [Gammaproteobacteria bacterium]
MATSALAVNNQALVPTVPVGSLDAYIDAVSRVPVLTREEEVRLAHRFRDDNDLEAARSLVIAHLRFVVHIARSYSGYGLQLGDLVQEGNIGLMKAVKRFDPEYGVRLVSFAVHWIRAEIHEFVLRNWRIVKVATTKAQRKLFFNLRKAKKHLGWLSADETAAVADDLGVSAKEVNEMEKRLYARDLGFDAPDNDDDESAVYSPSLYLTSGDVDPQKLVVDDDLANDRRESMFDALEELDQRSRNILESRWLTEKKRTLQDLANEYGVSAERIRQIEAAAIKKLKAAVAA